MKNAQRMFGFYLYILIIILFIGCSRESLIPDQMDKSPFTGIPCAAPCWYGLTIGESNESNLTSILPTLTFINQDSIRRFPKSYVDSKELEIHADCLKPIKHCYTFYFIENILSEIDIVLNYKIEISEAVDFLGAPDYIGYRITSHDKVICIVNAIWSDKQLVLASKPFIKDEEELYCGSIRDFGKPISNMLISGVSYMTHENIDRLMANPEWFFRYSGMIQEQ